MGESIHIRVPNPPEQTEAPTSHVQRTKAQRLAKIIQPNDLSLVQNVPSTVIQKPNSISPNL